MEKEKTPGMDASIAGLDEMLQQIISGSKENVALAGHLHTKDFSDIRWDELRHLRIIGHTDSACLTRFEKNGLGQGAYSNDDDRWILMVFSWEHEAHSYLRHCGPSLRSLAVENCYISAGQLKLGHLTGLTSLRLSHCRVLHTLVGLENLTQLTNLFLFQCNSIATLSGLKNLTKLTKLGLWRCEKLATLPGLGKLTQLTTLNLRQCSSLTALPGLENLAQLTTLDLAHCNSLTALSGLENLTQLTKLDLAHCNSLTALSGLENLTQLATLDLTHCSSLASLPEMENLTQLTELTLWGCRSLSLLPSGIHHCENLQWMELCDMHLQDLPDWLPEIADSFSAGYSLYSAGNKAAVWLHGTIVDTIKDMSIFDQPYAVIAEWFRKRKLGEIRPLNEIKVVFLGDGEAGKSHTIARLMNDGGTPNHAIFDGQSTPGIVIRNKEYDLGDRKITVHYWDFGGQEIMHSMHRIFLTGRTMYVILLNARDDTQNDRAKYWLHNVKSFAPDAPVLLVLNKIDQNPNASVDEKKSARPLR